MWPHSRFADTAVKSTIYTIFFFQDDGMSDVVHVPNSKAEVKNSVVENH